MRVAIIGAEGQLGSDATQAFSDSGHRVFGLSHRDVEIAEIESVAA
jgi:dTDP-4-dehydrorhamnose reductase